MPPSHNHHPANCGCVPDEHLQVDGIQDHLYAKVDRERIVALNAAEGSDPKAVVRPWDQRLVEDEYLESDADEQLILQIPFTGSIKLRSIIIKAGPQGQTPDSVKIFVNKMLDFDEASSTDPTQSIELPISRDPVEYALRPAKFPAVQNLTLFFPSNHGDDTTRIYFVGFRGEYSALTRDPIITVYEAQANPADHQKIQGLDSTSHSRIG